MELRFPCTNPSIYCMVYSCHNFSLQELLLKEQVKDFAANVYEAFSQPEMSPAWFPGLKDIIASKACVYIVHCVREFLFWYLFFINWYNCLIGGCI